MPFIIGGGAPQTVSGNAAFTAQPVPSVAGRATFSARPPEPVAGSALFTAYPVIPAGGSGVLDLRHDVTLMGLPADMVPLAWAYSHTGQYEELEVTVTGLHGLDTPSVTLKARTVDAAGAERGRLPDRGFQTLGQEPQVDEGQGRTTFRFRNDFDARLRGVKLPELIPWRLEPPRPGCVTERRRVSIADLVLSVMREHVDLHFRLDVNPLQGAAWEEGRRDYSTLGKTPQQLWDDTFGQLGMEIHVTPLGAQFRPVGRWPNPTARQEGGKLPDELILSRNPQRQNRQTPTRLTVRGADAVTDLTPNRLLEWVGADDPAFEEIAREVLPEGEFIDPVTTSGTARTARGWRKTVGQLISEVQVTTDDVTAQETVDGVGQVREFRGVATGYAHTDITLDPACPARPLRKVTRTKSWAYGPGTVTGTFSTTGPGLYWKLTTGDLTADEETITTYTYSPQGHEVSVTESSTALASVQQAGAEGPQAERGPVQGREYVRTVKRTSWQGSGAGRWQRVTLASRQKLVPLYDADTGEAVRTQLVTSTVPLPTEITDQAPQSYDCGACDVKEVRDPTGVVLSAGDAGFAEAQEVTVDFLTPDLLIPIARALLTQHWHRIVTTFTAPLALPFLPGDWVNGALVQDVRLSQAEGSADLTTELTTAALDTSLLAPTSAGVYDLDLSGEEGRAVMLAGAPGGARVRLVRGWQAQAQVPDTASAFVRYRTGFPPRPGDEVDWVRYAGRLEARSAR